MLRRILLLVLLLVACTSLYADVTMRMALDFKVNLTLPGALPQLPFNEVLTRIHGDRSYAVMGPFIAITDLSTGKITLLDPKTQHYATIAMANYISKIAGANGQAMPNLPDAAKQILEKMKFDTESRDTGRTSRIQGIDAYEREVVIHVSIPLPIPGQENGLALNLKFDIWKPTPSELERVPALRELVAYNERNKGFGDVASMMRQIFGSIPGMGDHVGKMVEEMTKGGNVTLGMDMGLYVPGLRKMLEQAGKADALPALPPDDQPLVNVKLELKELSTDKIPDSVFAIPVGFQEAPMEDLMKGMTSALAGAKPEEAQPGAKPREAQPAAKPEAAKPAKLTLTVEPSGKDLQITWEKDSAIIANANHGVLSINDGNRDQKYEMDAKQLKVGSIVYTPVGSEVSFKLEVTGKDGSKTAATPTRWSNSPASLAPEDKPAAK